MFIRDIPNAMSGTIIDVRSREDYDLSHAKDSINIPWDLHLYYLNELEELSQPWIFCCEDGIHSSGVVQSLKMLGYEDVYIANRWFDIDREKAEMLAKVA